MDIIEGDQNISSADALAFAVELETPEIYHTAINDEGEPYETVARKKPVPSLQRKAATIIKTLVAQVPDPVQAYLLATHEFLDAQDRDNDAEMDAITDKMDVMWETLTRDQIEQVNRAMSIMLAKGSQQIGRRN